MKLEDDLITTRDIRSEEAVTRMRSGGVHIEGNTLPQRIGYLDVFAQRYSSSGDPLGGQYRVNTYTTNNQIYPSVAIDPSGNHVVTWTSCWTQDGSG